MRGLKYLRTFYNEIYVEPAPGKEPTHFKKIFLYGTYNIWKVK
jgi:hypothetical protein